jgi:Carboxypeptidase regulatory-like domain/TonB dependent receptor-like, beta-barrel
MSASSSSSITTARRQRFGLLACALIGFGGVGFLLAQNASTGALVGTASDPTGAVLPGTKITVTREFTQEIRTTNTQATGDYGVPLLSPGVYTIKFEKAGFRATAYTGIKVRVTETTRVDARLTLGQVSNEISVTSHESDLQTENSALGRVVDETAVSNLPLVTRNFTQIAGLSPGVISGVNNAGELGLGGGGVSQIEKSNDGIFVHGTRSYDNNFQLDGVSVSDVQGSGGASGGIPIPNPDTIQEFKVQTALYDAAFGRYAGANVSIVSKSGGDRYHGSAFEFLRNDVLNANDFFRSRTGQPRPVLKQNQFGFTLGGPIRKEKLFWFGSYQGTRQVNGLAAGQARVACSATLSTPPLTDDRTSAALGKLFGGMSGLNGGVAVSPEGSNINPVALALLNFKLADGSFLIPNPQTVDAAKPPASQGLSTFSDPCHFDEDQFVTSADYVVSPKSRIAGRFFLANDDAVVTFPGSALNSVGNIRGFPGRSRSNFRVFSISHTYALDSQSLNEIRIGYVRTTGSTVPSAPFKWSNVGVAESDANGENDLPTLSILGSVSFAPAFPRTITQNSMVLSDNLSLIRGKHAVTLGGSVTRVQDNLDIVGIGSFVQFLSWPDFLLGLDATGNGTGSFSNVFGSIDNFGLLDREYRAWEGSAFAQDDYRISTLLTLNFGLRYERLGQFGDDLGRNSSFDISRASRNPPAEGSFSGYVVGSNFPGNLPPGVVRADNHFANNAHGQDLLAPRVGFAWQPLPQFRSMVMRGGYGMYFSRPTGQAFFQNVFSPPFSLSRLINGQANANATFQEPFQQPFPTLASFPEFRAYSPTTSMSIVTVSPDFQPSMVQQYGLNFQAALHPDWLLEIGYVGTRGTHLLRLRSQNQALSASVDHPIRGQTDNTLANVSSRVPILGIVPNGLVLVESEGDSWYNGLEVSLTKRMSRGLQFLASYTFAKALDTDGANINATSSGNTITRGDQNDPRQRWGRASFDRSHRLVFSTTYDLPSPAKGVKRAILGGWLVAGVTTIQSGSALTIIAVNSKNVFGISQDRAQVAAGCTSGQLVTAGSVESKLNNYFKKPCFTTSPVVGADAIGTAFGNSGTGIVNGPAQFNVDVALSKTMELKWPVERSRLRFRAEFFNALNHSQFDVPDANFSSPTFGVIQTTAVNPRVIQVALELSF